MSPTHRTSAGRIQGSPRGCKRRLLPPPLVAGAVSRSPRSATDVPAIAAPLVDLVDRYFAAASAAFCRVFAASSGVDLPVAVEVAAWKIASWTSWLSSAKRG